MSSSPPPPDTFSPCRTLAAASCQRKSPATACDPIDAVDCAYLILLTSVPAANCTLSMPPRTASGLALMHTPEPTAVRSSVLPPCVVLSVTSFPLTVLIQYLVPPVRPVGSEPS